MKKYLFFVAMVMIIHVDSFASDTLRIDRKYYETYRWDRNFVSQIKYNPSIYFFHQNYSFSEIGVMGSYTQNDKSLLLQQGEDIQTISVNSSTYTILSPNSKAWGTASYENSKRYKVKFNNTSDWELLYPYITADSVGGDMRGETYSFSGGYGHQLKKVSLAATMSYRAMIEYRDVDPRPKNVVSDLTASIGASRLISPNYRLGMSLNVGKYKQTNTIKNYSELGGVPQYHLTGLGTEYSRFSGTFPNTFYDGLSYGGTINFVPDNKKGIYISVSYDIFNVDKSMNDLNDIVLTSLTNREIKVEVAYLKNQNGIKVDYFQRKKKGIENIFGAASGGYYPMIASNENYSNTRHNLSVTGLFGRTKDIHTWLIMPQIAYNSSNTEHISTSNYLNYSSLSGKLDFQYSLRQKKATYVATVGASYDKNSKNDGELNYSVNAMKPLIDSYLKLSKENFYNLYMKLRTDIPVSSIKSGLFIELNVRYGNPIHTGVFISVGGTF